MTDFTVYFFCQGMIDFPVASFKRNIWAFLACCCIIAPICLGPTGHGTLSALSVLVYLCVFVCNSGGWCEGKRAVHWFRLEQDGSACFGCILNDLPRYELRPPSFGACSFSACMLCVNRGHDEWFVLHGSNVHVESIFKRTFKRLWGVTGFHFGTPDLQSCCSVLNFNCHVKQTDVNGFYQVIYMNKIVHFLACLLLVLMCCRRAEGAERPQQ